MTRPQLDRLLNLLEEAEQWIRWADQDDWRTLSRVYDTRSAWLKECKAAQAQLSKEVAHA